MQIRNLWRCLGHLQGFNAGSVSRPHLALTTKIWALPKGLSLFLEHFLNNFFNFNEGFRWFKAQRNGYFALFDAAAAVTESSAAVKVVSTETLGCRQLKFWVAQSLREAEREGGKGRKPQYYSTAAVCSSYYCCCLLLPKQPFLVYAKANSCHICWVRHRRHCRVIDRLSLTEMIREQLYCEVLCTVHAPS